MSTTQGVIVILAVGLVVLGVAILLDWRSKRRAESALSSAPATQTPAGVPLPTPDYVHSDEVTNPDSRTTLTDEEAAALDEATTAPGVLHFDTGLLDPRQAMHHHPDRMVLTHPLVLVVKDAIGSSREVMQTLERAATEQEPLLLVSSAIDPEVVDLVTVNVQRGVLRAGTLVLPEPALSAVAKTTGATPVSRVDLQSGFVPHSVYGRASWVTADASHTLVIPRPEPSSEQ